MKWITREHPKIDRIACPWLIKRFIDKDAEIIYAPFDEVLPKAALLNAIPFDIPGAEYTHYGVRCTFDYFIEKHGLKDDSLLVISEIVRGADTDRHDIATQASGLWAISAGLAHNIKDDYRLLETGMMIYDALYSWAKYLRYEKHTNAPFENLLLDVYNKFLKNHLDKKKKPPTWVKELKEIIQDQVDANFALSLKNISGEIAMNPSYLSREFAKHFENLSFGEYIHKLRLEKAINLIQTTPHTLTEIAYLTGFSDQSHFTRIFKKHTGKNPSDYRKAKQKK